MVFARLLSKLLRDKEIGRRIVPIIPDEARTFGMDALFSQVGIYSALGQLYEPVDKGKVLYYRESKDGQVLEEGITEAGSMASFQAAATAYATHGEPMMPFYIFYSMFGFQRTGDQMWQAGDAMARGFLLGATAGRTTLNGEGLQHEDGHSHLLASTVPVVRRLRRRVRLRARGDHRGRPRAHAARRREHLLLHHAPERELRHAADARGREGGHPARHLPASRRPRRASSNHVQLFGSGSIMNEVLRAQKLLAERFDVSADVWGVTSYQQLRRDALALRAPQPPASRATSRACRTSRARSRASRARSSPPATT